MSQRKKAALFFFLSLVGLGIGYVLINSIQLGFCVCTPNLCDPLCVTSYARIGTPMFFGASALTIVTFLLLLLPKAVKTWSKFAIWSLPVLILIFALYPTPSGVDYFTPRPEEAFKWLSGLYLVVSLFIIGIASLRKR